MPRDVVYAPTSMVGMGTMDSRIEQLHYALRTAIGHMRRQDNAGKCLIAMLFDTQVEIGISFSFYHADPKEFQYVTKKHKMVLLMDHYGLIKYSNTNI